MLSPDATIHKLAAVSPDATVGARTRVWQFCVVLPGASLGEDCNICAQCLIEGNVKVGSRVTVKSGVQLWDGVILEDDVFVGPNATFTNDLRPRSKRYPQEYAKTLLKEGCSIGANATLLPVTIGRWAMVAAGAVVTRDVPDFALMRGNSARLVGWVCRCGEKLNLSQTSATCRCACGAAFRQIHATHIEEIQP
jgi:acetyltransferase-like isoleucine patch superfamily enzyme